MLNNKRCIGILVIAMVLILLNMLELNICYMYNEANNYSGSSLAPDVLPSYDYIVVSNIVGILIVGAILITTHFSKRGSKVLKWTCTCVLILVVTFLPIEITSGDYTKTRTNMNLNLELDDYSTVLDMILK